MCIYILCVYIFLLIKQYIFNLYKRGENVYIEFKKRYFFREKKKIFLNIIFQRLTIKILINAIKRTFLLFYKQT